MCCLTEGRVDILTWLHYTIIRAMRKHYFSEKINLFSVYVNIHKKQFYAFLNVFLLRSYKQKKSKILHRITKTKSLGYATPNKIMNLFYL